MVKLYLNNELADITNNIDISLTYEVNDVENPEAVKSAYSKTVVLEGTETNNKIFSHIYRSDKEIVDGTELIGSNFNPNLRVPAYIELDGDMVDSGYFKLDSISVSNNHIQYNITIFLGVGDFFYNLMYDDDEEEKTLASLYYEINGMTKEQEDKRNLFEYNKEFVLDCWNARLNGSVDTNSLNAIFCPIPTYSGLYDDFESNKVLTNEGSPIPQQITEDKKTYIRENAMALVEMPRELSEWEIRDLRSHNQRLGIRLKNVYDAIKNPINNGGYEVDDTLLDDNSKKYIKDGYIMLDRFDYESLNESSDVINISLSKNPLIPTVGNKEISVSTLFSLNDMINPHITVSIEPEIKFITDKSGEKAITIGAYNSVMLDYSKASTWEMSETTYGTLVFGTMQFYYLRFFNNSGSDLGIGAPTAFAVYDPNERTGIISNVNRRGVIEKRLFDKAKMIVPELDETNINYKYYNKNDVSLMLGMNSNVGADKGRDFASIEFIKLTSPIPKDATKVQIECVTVNDSYLTNLKMIRKYEDEGGLPQSDTYPIKGDKELYDYEMLREYYNKPYGLLYNSAPDNGMKSIRDIPYFPFEMLSHVNNTEDGITQIYDGSIETATERHTLNKKQIFTDSKTPFDYLISLGKLLNWCYEKDINSKKIRIYSKFNYYDKKYINIENDIDRKEYSIIPTTIEYNKYKFNVPLPDTYQTDLFKKKNNRIYSQFIYKPNYQFNSESNELFEENSFTLAMPYMMHSVFLTNNNDIPTCTMGNAFKVTLWGNEDDTTIEREFQGSLLKGNEVSETNDDCEKLCCFDKENGDVTELTDVFVLYNGKCTPTKRLWISDDIPFIKEINGNNCYIMTNGYSIFTSITSSERAVVQKRVTEYPIFTNTNGDVSLLFNESEGNKDLWNLFFKNQYTNLYTKNNKIVTIKYFLKEKPQDALKHYYIFDNCVWILNKINDYKPNMNEPTECEFIKVINPEKYCKSE